VFLKHIPGDPLPWQWHSETQWRDPVMGIPVSYYSSFPTEESAIEYGKRNGWINDD
jgi:hypothetical protein